MMNIHVEKHQQINKEDQSFHVEQNTDISYPLYYLIRKYTGI